MAKKLSLFLFTLLILQLVPGYPTATCYAQTNAKEIFGTLRVMTYNIHHCNPPAQRGVINIDAIARIIAASGADVVFLQEVDVNTGRSGKGNQAEEIAKRSGLGYFRFYKAIDFSGGEYGGAIVSRFPLSEELLHRLPTQDGEEQRLMGSAVIEHPKFGKIMVATTHLDLNQVYRKFQIKHIRKFLVSQKIPVILGGDFNADSKSAEMKLVYRKFTPSELGFNPTFPNTIPTKHIDYLFLRNHSRSKFKMEFTNHRVLKGFDASDHLPVVADVIFFEK
ncbi:MAG: endonuclease [Bacteroidetes bacterium HGW-Bacteroidetes-7]|jgi:endonuclease/exonuclease/phosphatase family metal-dependent hydrolase|nr:MAG: endonuclease [Bacteroidetes bacterium HGW-Bacteroidetes-7]